MLEILKGMSIIALSAEYRLIEIQEEKVPLEQLPEVNSDYSGMVIGVMILLMAVLIVALYFFVCHKYRARIRQLRHTDEVYQGWNLRCLKETVMEMEQQEAERIVRNMEENFKKNVFDYEPFFE